MFSRIVLVGAGKTSDSLVERLARVAPILVIDKSEKQLLEMPGRAPTQAGDDSFRHPIGTRAGDGTSRLVLEDARGDATDRVALLATTGSDRVNLEVCRLARELGFAPIVAIAIDPAEAPKYEALEVRAIVRSVVIGQTVERELQFEGLSMATTVGLGKGEIIEFKVLPSSPIIGVPLRELDSHGWRIAAIYRDERLVLPTGTTAIAADDWVMVVGEPRILPLVAENLRIGLPMFPLRHGHRVVVYLPGGRDRDIEHEAEVIALQTRATGLLRLWPGATNEKTVLDDPLAVAIGSTDSSKKVFADAPLAGATVQDHVQGIKAAQPGVVVARCGPRRVWERLLGQPGRDGRLCDALECPVVFPRGEPRYHRIVYLIAEGIGDLATVDAAIDLARMFEVPMEVVRVELPAYMGKPEASDSLLANVERRARLHQVRATTTRLEGNPIKRIIASVRPDDLLVVTRRKGARDGYTSPDVALRIARSAPCSTLVATLQDG